MSEDTGIRQITERNVEAIAKMEKAESDNRSFGERLADLVVKWVGSWTFLIVQSALLLLWMFANVVAWWSHWDPYPFVLLNLVLSFQAAFSSPVILMSENRQSRLSERRNHLDLQINLLAEQENSRQLRLLELLCEKAGIEIDKQDLEAYEETTEPSAIVQQITRNVEPHVQK